MARTNAQNARSGRSQGKAPEAPATLVIDETTEVTRDLLTREGFDALALHTEVSGRYVRGSLYVDSIVTEAAYATFALERDGYLYATTDETPVGYMDGKAYANAYALRSQGNVSLWRTLGYLLMVVGMDEKAPEYLTLKKGIPSDLKKFICRNRDHKGTDPAPAVPTVDEVVAEMARYFDRNGKKLSTRKGPNEGTVNPGGTDTGSTGTEVSDSETAEKDPNVTVLQALALLSDACKRITDEEWTLTEEALAEIVTRENTIREGKRQQAEQAEQVSA